MKDIDVAIIDAQDKVVFRVFFAGIENQGWAQASDLGCGSSQKGNSMDHEDGAAGLTRG